MLLPRRISILLFCLAAVLPAQDVTQLHDEAFVMDGHIHVMMRQLLQGLDIGDRYPDGDVDLPRAREGGLDAMFFSIYTPEPYYPGRFETKHTLRVLSLARDQIAQNADVIELALNASDIERINRAGKMAAFIDLEGGFDLDGDLNVLRGLYALGLRSVQLTAHNYTNNFADSCCDTRKWGGLNDQGRAVVKEMNRLGIVINVAHASEETILQTVELSEDPVIFSHGGFRHFVDIPRCISDKAAKAVAAKGGVIGLQWGSTFNNPKYYAWRNEGRPAREPNAPMRLDSWQGLSLAEIDARLTKGQGGLRKPLPDEYWMHVDQLANVIDYAVGLVGEDHIALGSDFDGGPPLPREIKDVSDYPEMTKALKRKGYSDSRIKKILGANWLRVIRGITEK
jgi:membrane dipeptidase